MSRLWNFFHCPCVIYIYILLKNIYIYIIEFSANSYIYSPFFCCYLRAVSRSTSLHFLSVHSFSGFTPKMSKGFTGGAFNLEVQTGTQVSSEGLPGSRSFDHCSIPSLGIPSSPSSNQTHGTSWKHIWFPPPSLRPSTVSAPAAAPAD